MMPQLLEAIVRGEQGINLTLSAKDLMEVVNSMLYNERRRMDEEMERRKELPCLTKKQVAEMLGIHPNTVGLLVKRGELTPVKIGVKVRFRQSDIDDYLQNSKRHNHL